MSVTTIMEKADIASIEKAGEILKRGGLVAFPTETVTLFLIFPVPYHSDLVFLASLT